VKELPAGIEEPLHPSGRELSDFERQLLRLRLIGHEAHLLICGLTRTDDRKRDDDLVLTLQNFALILICRFLEIWGKFQSLGGDNRRVLEIARAASLYLDRINIWPGLREYRNWILAHRYQIDPHPAFIPPWIVHHTGRVPTKPAEWMVLLDCVQQASAAVMAYYGDIYRGLRAVLHPGQEPETTRGVLTGEEAQAERERLAIEMGRRLAALGVRLDDPVFQEYVCRPPDPVG
jgi:hypothetical protein